MPYEFAHFVQLTFYAGSDQETDAELLANCAGSFGSCSAGMQRVFRFYDEKGRIGKYILDMRQTKEALDALAARVRRARLPRPLLNMRLRWKDRRYESMRAQLRSLISRQMAVADYVVEECKGALADLSNDDLLDALAELRKAKDINVTIHQGSLRDSLQVCGPVV